MPDPIAPFRDLTPPPGGLERLRQRIEAGRGWRRPAWTGVVAATCGLAVLALVLLPGWLQRARTRAQFTAAVRQAMQPIRPGELRVVNGAALALESGQPGVRIYLVQSTGVTAVGHGEITDGKLR